MGEHVEDLPLACLYCAAAIAEKSIGRRGYQAEYCSVKCNRAHRREQAARRDGTYVAPGSRSCPTCLTPVVGGTQRRRYCSRACNEKAVAARAAARKAAQRPVIACTACGEGFLRARVDQTCCSRKCWNVSRGLALAAPLPHRLCALVDCGAEFQPKKTGQRACSETHGKKLWNRENPEPWNDRKRDHYHRRRALKAETSTGRPVLLSEIRERDGNRCHLCRDKVSAKPYPHPLSASLDHVVPLSRGGIHDPDNVKLAHLRCNVEKGAGGGNEQLLLIG